MTSREIIEFLRSDEVQLFVGFAVAAVSLLVMLATFYYVRRISTHARHFDRKFDAVMMQWIDKARVELKEKHSKS